MVFHPLRLLFFSIVHFLLGEQVFRTAAHIADGVSSLSDAAFSKEISKSSRSELVNEDSCAGTVEDKGFKKVLFTFSSSDIEDGATSLEYGVCLAWVESTAGERDVPQPIQHNG